MMSRFFTASKNFFTREDGASMTEYGLLLALIAVVCIAVITLLGTQLQAIFQTVVNAL